MSTEVRHDRTSASVATPTMEWSVVVLFRYA